MRTDLCALTVALSAITVFGPAAAAMAQDTTAPAPTVPAAAPLSAQPSPGDPAPPPAAPKRFRVGPELGFYVPTSSKTRDAFGGTWFNYGVGFGTIPVPGRNGQFTAAFNLSSYNRQDDRALLAPLALGYRWGLGDDPRAMPYIGVSGIIGLADLESKRLNIDSGMKPLGGAALVMGSTFQDRGYLQVRYMGLSKVSGFDLSGVNFSTGFRF